jgi:hypothetical protein
MDFAVGFFLGACAGWAWHTIKASADIERIRRDYPRSLLLDAEQKGRADAEPRP